MSYFSTIRPAPATNHKQKFNYQVSSDPEKKHIEQYQWDTLQNIQGCLLLLELQTDGLYFGWIMTW